MCFYNLFICQYVYLFVFVILNAYNPYSTTSLLSLFCPRPTVYNIFQQVCNCSSRTLNEGNLPLLFLCVTKLNAR